MLGIDSEKAELGVEQARNVLGRMDRKGILQLATDNLTVQYHARSLLQNHFLSDLKKAGVPSPVQFYDVMKNNNLVISGSFVTAFVDPEFVQTWTGDFDKPGDIDVYAGKGHLDTTLDALSAMEGVEMTILQYHTRPIPYVDEHGRRRVGPREDVIYNNIAVNKMARLQLRNEGGTLCYMDVMESISDSPVFPIARFDLTHLRRGISRTGFFDLHPTWHNGANTFASPKAIQAVDGRIRSEYFLAKYRDRGYVVSDRGVVDGLPPHTCETSPECPLTLRNTADTGVFFAPFTEEAAIKACNGDLDVLSSPLVYWKHGGCCNDLSKPAVESELYDANGVDSRAAEQVYN